jgi:hypothetical protein
VTHQLLAVAKVRAADCGHPTYDGGPREEESGSHRPGVRQSRDDQEGEREKPEFQRVCDLAPPSLLDSLPGQSQSLLGPPSLLCHKTGQVIEPEASLPLVNSEADPGVTLYGVHESHEPPAPCKRVSDSTALGSRWIREERQETIRLEWRAWRLACPLEDAQDLIPQAG